MPIIDFGPLGQVDFGDISESDAKALMETRGDEIRQRLMDRARAELEAQTATEEATSYLLGEVPLAERVGSTLMSLPRAASEQTAGTLKGLGRLQTMGGDTFAPGTEPSAEISETLAREAFRRAQDPQQRMERTTAYQAGQRLAKAAPEVFPTLPGVEESFPSQVSAGVGSVAALLPASLTGPAAPAVAGGMYGLSAGEAAAEDARATVDRRIQEALADGNVALAAELERRRFDIENTAFLVTAPIGAVTEGSLGVAGKLRVGSKSIGGIGSKLAEALTPTKYGGLVERRVRGGIEGAVTEAAQEMSEQLLSNAAAKAVYDPDRPLGEGVLESGLIGGVTGGMVGGIVGSERPKPPLPLSAAAVAGREAAAATPPAPTPPPTPAGGPPLAPVEEGVSPDLTLEDVQAAVAEADRLRQEEEARLAALPPPPAPTPPPAPAPEGTAPPPSPATETTTPPENAIQEQGADEGVLRSEGPQVELPQVDQGVRPPAGGGPETVQAQEEAVTPPAPAPPAAVTEIETPVISTAATAEPAAATPATISPNIREIEYVNNPEYDNATGTVKRTSGTTRVVEMAGRKIVLVNVNGVPIPFYLSTGTGGKANVAVGKWYPILGVGPSGWLNKGSQSEINDYYGSPILREIAERLDRDLGKDVQAKKVSSSAIINSVNAGVETLGITPIDNDDSGARKKLDQHISKLKAFLNSSQSQELATPATTPPTPTPDAVREQATDEVGVRDQAGVREGMGGQDQVAQGAAEVGQGQGQEGQVEVAAAPPAAVTEIETPVISTAATAEPAAAQAAEVTTPEVAKQDRPPLAPRAQKQYLLEEIDKAIEAAPEQVSAESIVVSVPGDGVFTLANNKAALKRFREMAKRFPTAPVAGEPSARMGAKQPIKLGKVDKPNALKAGFEVTATPDARPGSPLLGVMSNGTKSYASNGKVLLEMDVSMGGTAAKPVVFDKNGKPQKFDTDYPNVANVLPGRSKPVVEGINTERLFNILNQAMAAIGRTIDADGRQKSFVTLVRNQDGSLGLYSEAPGQATYAHNVQPDAKILTAYDIELLTDTLQAMRRLGAGQVNLEFEKAKRNPNDPGILTAPGVRAVLMPMRLEKAAPIPAWAFESTTPAAPAPTAPAVDPVVAALDKAIKATDPRGKAFEFVAGISYTLANAALRIAKQVYLKTRDLTQAVRAGMAQLRRTVDNPENADWSGAEAKMQAMLESEGVEFREDITPPDPTQGGVVVDSRGRFRGPIRTDTVAEWNRVAEKWLSQFGRDLNAAAAAAVSGLTQVDPAVRQFALMKLIERIELEITASRNDIRTQQLLQLQERVAAAAKDSGAIEFGKVGSARANALRQMEWLMPVLTFRGLVREAQSRLKFPNVVSDAVRAWLEESGRQAIAEIREAMSKANNVAARELNKAVRDMGVTWREIIESSLDIQGAFRQELFRNISKHPELRSLSPQGRIELANLLATAWERQRAKIFRSEFRKKVQLPKVSRTNYDKILNSVPRILKWANIGLLDNEAFRNAIAPEFGIETFDGETAKEVARLAQEAQAVGGVNRNRRLMEIYKYMQNQGAARYKDLVRDYWYAAVLSGIRTHVDSGINLLNGAMQITLATLRNPLSAPYVIPAYFSGLREAFRDVLPIVARGELFRNVNFNAENQLSALEAVGESANTFVKGLSIGKFVGRVMVALDHLNSLSTRQGMMAWALYRMDPEQAKRFLSPEPGDLALARAEAEAEGTPPELMDKRIREILEERIPSEIVVSANELGKVASFQNNPYGFLGAIYNGIQLIDKNVNIGGWRPFKIVTGTQFARYAFNYTNEVLNYVAPVALYRWFMSAPSRQQGPGGLEMSPEMRDLILMKAGIGTALGAMAAALFLGDDDEDEKDRFIDMTGSFKSLDPKKRRQLLSEGRQPYSIRVGDTYISYRQFGFGGVLGAIGELRDRQLFEPEKWSQDTLASKVSDAAAAGVFIVRDSSALTGLMELIGATNAYKYSTDDLLNKSLPRWFARFAGSFVPNIAKEIDAWTDPSIFQAKTGHEFFLQQVPYFRRELGAGPILNVLGEPVKVERYPWSRWIATRKEDPAWQTLGELASRGVFMPMPGPATTVDRRTNKRRPMTDEEQYKYQLKVGKEYRKYIEANGKRLLKMQRQEAIEEIDQATDRIRRLAR